MKVFSYIRVSGLAQVDKDGPQRQREAINAFCARNNLQPMAEFFDEGVSGTIEGMDRPKFAEMMAKTDFLRQSIESDSGRIAEVAHRLFNIEAIVVERMDRLARDLMVSEFLLRECRARGLKVFCADQGELIDMASNDVDPTRVMFRQILAAIAQWEKSVTVKKLHAARLRYRKHHNDECEGQKRYGRHNLDEYEIKQEITRLHEKEGLSYAAIADTLNGRGLLTKHKKAWNKSNVNTVYSERRTKRKLNERSILSIPADQGVLRGEMPESQNGVSGGSACQSSGGC